MSPEVAPFSILFESPEDGLDLQDREEPACFRDLNLDQVFDAVTAARRGYDLTGYYRTPLASQHAVRYRQDVFRDLQAGLVQPVELFAEQMRQVRSGLRGTQEREQYDRYEAAAWFLEAGDVYSTAVVALEQALSRFRPAGLAFQRCHDYLAAYTRSAAFRELLEETARIKRGLAEVRYCVRIRGGRVTVTDYRGEPDYSVEVLDTFKKFQEHGAESHLVNFPPEYQNHIQDRIVGLVAHLHPRLFQSLVAYRSTFADFVDRVVARFDREVQFYTGYLAYLKPVQVAGQRFCYPDVSESRTEVGATATFDLALARQLAGDRRPVVTNDFHLNEGERIFVVSGPNQGGKTTFARTFGQLHYLASLGCPVPGSRAHLSLCDRIFTHFEKEEQIDDLHGKLQEELLRVRELLRQATGRSVVIMNESFASTTAQDSLLLGREVIGRLVELDALAVYVTFIDELSRLGPTVVSMVSTVDAQNPAERTFKILRKPADGRAYALAVAEKHGLTPGSIRARIQP